MSRTGESQSGGFLTSRSTGQMSVRAPSTPRPSWPEYERHEGDAPRMRKALGHKFFWKGRPHAACGNEWLYTLDLAWDEENARLNAIQAEKDRKAAAAAAAEVQRRRSELEKRAEPVVRNVELLVMEWLIDAQTVTAKQEMDLARIAAHKEANEAKRKKEEERKKEEKAREDARNAAKKKLKEEKEGKEMKKRAKAEKEKADLAAMKASFGM